MVKRRNLDLINLIIIIVSIFSWETVSAIKHHHHKGHHKSRGVRFMPDRQLNNLI